MQFLRQAARDDDVVTIKQTLYRTSNNSPIVQALCEAAEAGKSVTAWLRSKRDSTRRPISAGRGIWSAQAPGRLWFRRSEDPRQDLAGGPPGKQTLRSYVHFGTGNYHPITAKVYTDLSFFTCKQALCQDAARTFNYMTGFAPPDRLEALALAPVTFGISFWS